MTTWTYPALLARLIKAINDRGFRVAVHPDGRITLEAKT